jgi:hypothetical protein
MESSIIITLSPRDDDGINEVFKIRPKLDNSGFTLSHTRNAITWITEKEYFGAISYLTDLLMVLPKTEFLYHYLTFEIPGFPNVKFGIYDLNEKMSTIIIGRLSDYMYNHWSVFNH